MKWLFVDPTLLMFVFAFFAIAQQLPTASFDDGKSSVASPIKQNPFPQNSFGPLRGLKKLADRL